MSVGLMGRKLGMTQIFDQEQGTAIPVTVIEVGPCTVTQIKTPNTDGYSAIQLGYGAKKEKTLTKPELGHLKKAEAPNLRHLKEYRVEDTSSYQLGQSVTAEDLFSEGQLVDVRGTSIGRGFAGYQKRHKFARGPKTHGSKNYRSPGSIGPGTTPGRVYPGTRMAGRMGGKTVTIRKLKVMKVDNEKNVILVKGSIPGKSGGLLSITASNLVGATAQ
ncbi:MAG: 50S ribosomal protein L3 [Halothece sp.]